MPRCQKVRRREARATDKLNVITFQWPATARFLCDWQRLIGENESKGTGLDKSKMEERI